MKRNLYRLSVVDVNGLAREVQRIAKSEHFSQSPDFLLYFICEKGSRQKIRSSIVPKLSIATDDVSICIERFMRLHNLMFMSKVMRAYCSVRRT